jgi:hypothetical protein
MGDVVTKPKHLTMGVDCPAPTPEQERERIAILRATVEQYLPEFARNVARMASGSSENHEATLFVHQDAFAAGYDDDEYTLLGMALKYAGLHGVPVSVVGTNHETF